MTLYVDREPHRLTEGMTGFVPSNRPHGFRVDSDDPLRVLAIFAPAGMADFFREVGTRTETRTIPEYHGPTEADLERMAVASAKFDMQRLGPLASVPHKASSASCFCGLSSVSKRLY